MKTNEASGVFGMSIEPGPLPDFDYFSPRPLDIASSTNSFSRGDQWKGIQSKIIKDKYFDDVKGETDIKRGRVKQKGKRKKKKYKKDKTVMAITFKKFLNEDQMNVTGGGTMGFAQSSGGMPNPCIIGDSLIAVADGRNAVSIKQLALEGKDVPLYSTNYEGKVEIKLGRNPRLTGEKKEVWKLTLDDGSYFIATPDHGIYLKNNIYKKLKDLLPNESISPFYSFDNNGYRQIAQTGVKMSGGRFHNRRQYRLIHEFFRGKGIDYKYYHIHHKDFNNKNDNIENLELMTRENHKWLHADGIRGKNASYFKWSDEMKFKWDSHPDEKNSKYINVTNDEILSHAKKLYKENGKFTSRMWHKYAKENGLPQSLWNDFRFKTYTNFKNQVIDNHKVVSVEFYGYEDVYNITTDDNHNYNIITNYENDDYIVSGGICVKNSGEVTSALFGQGDFIAGTITSMIEDPYFDNLERKSPPKRSKRKIRKYKNSKIDKIIKFKEFVNKQ